MSDTKLGPSTKGDVDVYWSISASSRVRIYVCMYVYVYVCTMHACDEIVKVNTPKRINIQYSEKECKQSCYNQKIVVK